MYQFQLLNHRHWHFYQPNYICCTRYTPTITDWDQFQLLLRPCMSSHNSTFIAWPLFCSLVLRHHPFFYHNHSSHSHISENHGEWHLDCYLFRIAFEWQRITAATDGMQRWWVADWNTRAALWVYVSHSINFKSSFPFSSFVVRCGKESGLNGTLGVIKEGIGIKMIWVILLLLIYQGPFDNKFKMLKSFFKELKKTKLAQVSLSPSPLL